jgi:hypothetical protein
MQCIPIRIGVVGVDWNRMKEFIKLLEEAHQYSLFDLLHCFSLSLSLASVFSVERVML